MRTPSRFSICRSVLGLLSLLSVMAPQKASADNDLEIHNTTTKKVFFIVKKPTPTTAFSLVDEQGLPIAVNAVPGTGSPTPYYYFHLNADHKGKLLNYGVNQLPGVAISCPVDPALNVEPTQSTGNAFVAQCSSTTGATFVEPYLTGTAADNIDISEVNGVNSLWQVDLPNGGWINGNFATSAGIIQVATVKNNPGSGPNYYGDYGNPGVYPFGCSNCASRYYNTSPPARPPGTLAAGCNDLIKGPLLVDVGCDNAINYYPTNKSGEATKPRNPAFELPPPGVDPLPANSYAPGGRVNTVPATQPTGYGLCQLSVSPSGNPQVPAGGKVTIKLLQYPYP